MSSTDKWNAVTYDDMFGYVSEYGKGIIELLQPNSGEKILDLGCGTGDLSYEISKSGACVLGMDAAPQMIETAQEKYKSLRFVVGNGENFQIYELFDAVFSNAAIHWMKNAEGVVRSVHQALRQGGRFVAEFGGKGNIAIIIQGITQVLQELYDIDDIDRNPWYFPSIGEYSSLLESNGFEVRYARHYDRPTKLPDGEKGIYHFLNQFADSFFYDIPSTDRNHLYQKIKSYIEAKLYKDGSWLADYRRIQIIAEKK